MHNYRSVTSEKSVYTDALVQRTASLSQSRILDSVALQNILSIINYLDDNFVLSKIILDIHDLWSESFFREGYRYGSSYDREAKTHHLLKPYSEFTPAEKFMEDTLGQADIKIIGLILRQRFPFLTNPPTDIAHLRATINKLQVTEAIGMLANDQDFVMSCAFLINDHWMETCQKVGITPDDDFRLAQTTEELLRVGGRAKMVLINNARLDILALTLFVERAL